MGISENTFLITKALKDIAVAYSFTFRKEVHLYPEHGRHSGRVDVEFSLPSGRPVLWFEIDNHPDRAAHNRLKLFGDVLNLIPVFAIEVLHGRAAEMRHTYPSALLDAGLVLPRRFFDSIIVPSHSYDSTFSALKRWIEQVFSYLANAPQWGTVMNIAAEYQHLIRNGSLQFAVAHLEAYSDLSWFLVGKGRLDKERAACMNVALCRMLQRAGYHREARLRMQLLRQLVSNLSSLSQDTNDEATTVEFLLSQPEFASSASLDHLSSAVDKVTNPNLKSKFSWRRALTHIAQRHFDKSESVIEEYLNLMSGSIGARSNTALLRTVASLYSQRGNPQESAHNYGIYERYLLVGDRDKPEGTVHGVVTSLYLKALAAKACGNQHAAELILRINEFCRLAGIPRSADGLREIGSLLPNDLGVSRFGLSAGGQKLTEELSRSRSEVLDSLCARIDLLCNC